MRLMEVKQAHEKNEASCAVQLLEDATNHYQSDSPDRDLGPGPLEGKLAQVRTMMALERQNTTTSLSDNTYSWPLAKET